MYNKLTFWTQKECAEDLLNKIKSKVSDEYQLKEYEFTSIENGFKFMFDDWSHGDIVIQAEDKDGATFIKISGSFDFEVVEVHKLVQDLVYSV